MLNNEHFRLLAGNPSKWDEELRQAGPANLVAMQEQQHARGRRTAMLVWGMYGWYVRAGTGLDNPSILAATKEHNGPLDGTRAAAIEWGTKWANADPDNREFCARNNHLECDPVLGPYGMKHSTGVQEAS